MADNGSILQLLGGDDRPGASADLGDAGAHAGVGVHPEGAGLDDGAHAGLGGGAWASGDAVHSGWRSPPVLDHR